MYAYCNNNPVMFVDPEGTEAVTKDQDQPLGIFEFLLGITVLFGALSQLINSSQPLELG